MAKEKQIIKRLTFAEGTAEQQLLDAAETRVATGEFATFNELCQAALQAFLTPDSTSAVPATLPAVAEPPPMTSLAPMLAALQSDQQEVRQLLQQIATQTAPVERQHDGEDATQLMEQLTGQLTELTGAVGDLRTNQENVTTLLQDVATHLSRPAAPPRVEVAMLVESLSAIQTAQATLQAEVRHLRESLSAALQQLPTAPQPVNGAQQAMATPSETTATDLTVSPATVNRLARFLEDF